MLAEVLAVHPRDAEGLFAEIAFRGGSTTSIQAWGDGARKQGQNLLLHLCASARGCRANVAGRVVLHARRFRVRDQDHIGELWFEVPTAGALPALEVPGQPTAAAPGSDETMEKVKAMRDRIMALRAERPGTPIEEQTPGQA
eukprot:868137-Amphidinium_carterae.1